MKCPHCGSPFSPCEPFSLSMAGGYAYAQVCPSCRHIIGIRPALDGDPAPLPREFDATDMARLEFERWLFQRRSGCSRLADRHFALEPLRPIPS